MAIRDAVRELRETAQQAQKKGKVKSVSAHWEDPTMASVTIDHGKRKVKDGERDAPISIDTTSHLDIPMALAKDLKLGDEVTVTTTVSKA